jgi:hypothetical protein
MGTRSQIGIENADGTVTGIYCHWDGYPSYNGRLLVGHYATEDRVRELIALGDISSLNEEIGEKHPFDTYHLKEAEKDPRWEKWTTAYGRDRGETDCGAEVYHNADYFFNNFRMGGTEYAYLFRNGVWYVRNTYNGHLQAWHTVEAVLKDEEETA